MNKKPQDIVKYGTIYVNVNVITLLCYNSRWTITFSIHKHFNVKMHHFNVLNSFCNLCTCD